MKKFFSLFYLTLLVGACHNESGVEYFSAERALYYFNSVNEICQEDSAHIWGASLCGPVMYVDQISRKIYASEPDKEGLLKLKDNIYTGTYPKEKIVDVIAIEYGGTLFAMVPLYEREDEYRIKAQTFHALTHVMQKNKGISPQSFNNRHLNERNARMWLKLEWKALYKAISAEGEERYTAIRDALIFRGARHESYPAYVNDETRFENYEGLATYTYTRLCTESKDEQKKRLLEGILNYYRYRSFAQNYGFVHGALYAYLLTDIGFSLSDIDTDNIDLGKLTKKWYDITLPEIVRDIAGSIAINYDIEIINEEEAERERKIKEATNRELIAFTDKPVLFVELESPSFGFEPEDPNTLDTLGTVYASIRVSDNWGKLVVTNTGCLITYNLKQLRVPAKGIKITRNHVYGEGWNLLLTDNWEVTKDDHNYFIKRLVP